MMQRFKGGFLAVALFGAAALVAPERSEAVTYTTGNTAANAPITNVVSVTYQDNNGHAMATQTASVTITVALLKSAPTLTAPATLTASILPDQSTTYAFTLATNANGPDSYALSTPTLTDMLNRASGNSTVDFKLAGDGSGTAITSITLGASTVSAGAAIPGDGSTTAVITCLPGSNAGGALNGIPAGATVYVGAHGPYTVTAVDTANWTLTVKGTDPYTPVLGDTVRQVQTFYLHVDASTATIDQGSSTAPTPDQTVVVSVEAHDSISNSSTASANTVTTIRVPRVVVTKLVRNTAYGDGACGAAPYATVGNCNGTNGVMINGHMFYTANVTAQPFQVLEYCISVENQTGGGNSGDAKDIRITDPLTSYTTFLANGLALSPNGSAPGNFSAVTAVKDGDAAYFDEGTRTISFYAGNGGHDGGNSTTAGGGILAAGATTYAIYQATVN